MEKVPQKPCAIGIKPFPGEENLGKMKNGLGDLMRC
jgi:hypothetical protein